MHVLATALAALVAFALLPGRAAADTLTLRPSADVGLPFWCSWGYDWDERCYIDDGTRLPVGGDEDKVWRSALRFPVESIAAGAALDAARLRLWFDGVCLAPRKTSLACGPRRYVVDVREVLSADWRDERESDLADDSEDSAAADAAAAPGWIEWDVTALVERWRTGAAPNNGLLLMLGAPLEDFGVSGPYLPSVSYPDATRQPRLVVTYS